ncbi:MAG: NUDIX domain-containing protein [Anaerolineae bacterium]|nr:NUDIX domain-containing protein [Anaerolineae bacterium]
MLINHRVRALLLTPRRTLLLIKRVRAEIPPYYVAPGGGVDPSDASWEAALHREMAEELGGQVEIVREVWTTEHPGDLDLEGWTVRHHYYICRLLRYDLTQRSGPEFSDPTRGQYIPEEFALDGALLSQVVSRPPELAVFLAANTALLAAHLDH